MRIGTNKTESGRAVQANPAYPAKAMYRVSGYQFYNTSEFDLAELVNDADHLAANFKSYIQGFSANIQDIIKSLDFDKQIDKMDKNNRLLSVVKAFSELDLNPVTIDNVKMGYIFEDLIRRFSENAEAGDHYTGRDIIKLMVNILLAEGCDEEVKKALADAVHTLSKNGAVVEFFSLGMVDYVIPAYYIIACAEASSNLERFDGVKYGYRAKEYDGLHDMYKRTRTEGFGEEVKRRIMLGSFVLSSGYYDAYYLKALRTKSSY